MQSKLSREVRLLAMAQRKLVHLTMAPWEALFLTALDDYASLCHFLGIL